MTLDNATAGRSAVKETADKGDKALPSLSVSLVADERKGDVRLRKVIVQEEGKGNGPAVIESVVTLGSATTGLSAG